MAISPEDPGPHAQGLSRGSRGLPPLTPHSSSGTLPPFCLPPFFPAEARAPYPPECWSSWGGRGGWSAQAGCTEPVAPYQMHPPFRRPPFGIRSPLPLLPGALLPRDSWGRPDCVGGILELGKAKLPNRGQGVAPSLSPRFRPSDWASSGLSTLSWLRAVGCHLPGLRKWLPSRPAIPAESGAGNAAGGL